MKKKGVYITCGLVCLAAAVIAGGKAYLSSHSVPADKSAAFAPTETEAQTQAATEVTETTPPTTETEAPYVSPVDFAGLKEVNPDIYAWLSIENTETSYAIVQDPEDDSYYLTHNSDGDYSPGGAIFSEHVYNGTDFQDPVTILYGHFMRDGSLFGSLQPDFTDDEFFGKSPKITVYTPEAEYTYGVFAAVPYSNDHILYYHQFEDEYAFQGFFDEVMSTRDLSAKFNESYAPEPGDKVLILSTCLIGNNQNRFLVMGKMLPGDQ